MFSVNVHEQFATSIQTKYTGLYNWLTIFYVLSLVAQFERIVKQAEAEHCFSEGKCDD
jgi:hypothetical protein